MLSAKGVTRRGEWKVLERDDSERSETLKNIFGTVRKKNRDGSGQFEENSIILKGRPVYIIIWAMKTMKTK